MKFLNSKKNICFWLPLVIASTGCNLHANSASPSANPAKSDVAPIKTEIQLNEAFDGNCFNVEKYVSSMKNLSPSIQIRHLTTNIKVSSETKISHNFLLRMIYGNFSFANIPWTSIVELKGLQQKNCKIVSMQTINQNPEDFLVQFTKNNYISFHNSSGQGYSFEWISPHQLKTTLKFTTGDFLCDQNSQILVTVENDYFWNSDLSTETFLPKEAVSEELISLISEATDTDSDTLYREDPANRESKLSVEALRKLSLMPIKERLQACE